MLTIFQAPNISQSKLLRQNSNDMLKHTHRVCITISGTSEEGLSFVFCHVPKLKFSLGVIVQTMPDTHCVLPTR